MKKMFIVNRNEFKVGEIYSKNDSKKFKKVEDFDNAVWQLTTKKNMIVLVEEIIEEKKITFKITEELDCVKIFNSDDILPVMKFIYLKEIKKVSDYSQFEVILNEFKKFMSSCLNLEFSLHAVLEFEAYCNDELYKKHIENIIENDFTREYLSKINKLKYRNEYYSNDIVDKLISIADKTSNLSYLLDFMSRLSASNNEAMYHFNPEIDLYEVLNLIDKYDDTGMYYVKLNNIFPYFELNYIQTKIIDLANKNQNNFYCIRFLRSSRYNCKFTHYKSLRLNELIDVIITYWNGDKEITFLDSCILKHLSIENLSKLLDKCTKEYDIKQIKTFLENNDANF